MDAVVLAGGQGTRLRSAVADVPKPLAPIGGRPFLAYLFDRLVDEGVCKIIVAAGYRGEQVRAAFGGEFRGAALCYEIEREPLGTGGALRNALARAAFPAFALNGDTYCEVPLAGMLAAHEHAGSRLTMAVRPVAAADRYGAVAVEGGRIAAFAAASLAPARFVSCGVYLFASNLLDDPALPPAFSFEKDFIEPRAAALRPLAFECGGAFIDIGTPADYARAETLLPQWHAVRAETP